MADQLCTPAELATFLDEDLDTYGAALAIEAATALVQSLVGDRIIDSYPAEAPELSLARATVLSLAALAYKDPKHSKAVLDYERAYRIATAAMDSSPHLIAALRLQHERRMEILNR